MGWFNNGSPTSLAISKLSKPGRAGDFENKSLSNPSLLSWSGRIARAELPERISLEIKRVRTLQVRTLRSFRCSRGAGANPGRNRSPFRNAALCLFLELLHFALRVVGCFRQLKKLFDEPVGRFGPETVADK